MSDMTDRGTLEGWLSRHRLWALVGVDIVAWTVSLLAFTLLRYIDVLDDVPWVRTLTAIAIAIRNSAGVVSIACPV